MARVLLLLPTKTYRAEALLRAALRMEVSLTVASEEPSTLMSANPSGLLTLDFKNLQQSAAVIADFHRRHPIDGIIPVDEETAVVAATLAEAIGLPFNSVASAMATRDKHRMRQLLLQGGVLTPEYSLYAIEQDPTTLTHQVRYPCVIKPLVLSSSRGVIRADNDAQFVAAFRRTSAILRAADVTGCGQSGRQVLVETFIPGAEFAVEGLLARGHLLLLALFDKPDPLDGPFFEETLYVTPSRQPPIVQEQIVDAVRQATIALGLCEGPVHAEVRFNARGAWVIEVAARSIGGRCSAALRFGAGVSLEELVIRHAIGIPIDSLERESPAAGVMMIPIPQAGLLREVRGLAEAKQVEGIEDINITIPLGRTVIPLPEGASYLGFIFARRSTPDLVEAALRQAHRCLEFEIA
ncbi:MAG: ATP-grasp domain-containing protein [Acidobacteria bacterium]|nr:ATP-grasp domain-containing protein [Acidobacteriota bacterium]MBI3658744.1 ATP-grasp domain-containing protein [Acidobacteriota bacterium]